ncbi:GGDEF domain-containing protein [Dyella sp. C9]|uniref:tetratricopeptide repeat-containing diguanylate cyclase n=1 Tax=Dyella sp. C9 TaxID=2202154 RepID=UPI001E5F1799|nr:GGDEF domain-containing protein [Dyella sp. C9]
MPIHARAQEARLGAQLEQIESLRTNDHARFVRLLETVRLRVADMSPRERWQFRYLDGWETSFQGDYAHAEPVLRDVIGHSGDPALVTKASAVLMGDLGRNKRYDEAFELANGLVAGLPQTQDKLARFVALSYLSQLLRSAGQYDLAAKYARDMAQELPPGESACKPMTILLSVLYDSHKLSSSSPELQRGVETCQAARDSVFTNTIWLVKASLYLDEEQSQKAIDLIQRIMPSIRGDQYYSNTLAAQTELAQAYWKQGNDASARKAALGTLASSDPNDIDETLRDAYQVLYRIERKHGNAAAALAHYEHYVAQDTGYLNDVRARALAYAVAQQHLLAQKLETEKLSRQNNVLRLQRALDTQAMETSRLYIVLLLVVLISVVLWLVRLKLSQLRFKRLSSIDGLTGILNHQNFIGAATRALHLLERKHGSAALVFIDLDNFKQINDNHGHATGDAVLRRTVAICQQALRTGDLFGRLGGEEFGILLLDCPADQGKAIAEQIRRTIESTSVDSEGAQVAFSASVGVATTEASGYDLQHLCREADAALYRAKRAGRNRVVVDTGHDGLVEA